MEVELDKKKLQFTNEDGQKVNVDIDQEQTEKEEEAFESNHYSNLAEELPEQEINLIGKELVRAYEDDKSSRKNWEDQYSRPSFELQSISQPCALYSQLMTV